MSEFESFPKIPRLSRDCVITEKIDGTNASVWIEEVAAEWDPDEVIVKAASRNRFITPQDDNFGFAAWVEEHATELYEGLGIGRHYGEWWGSGIQRNYGLAEKRFSLFNTKRWVKKAPSASFGDVKVDPPEPTLPNIPGLDVVPTLYEGPFSTVAVENALNDLRVSGSVAAKGFLKPEGVVVYHTALNGYFKKTIEGDGVPKGRAA